MRCRSVFAGGAQFIDRRLEKTCFGPQRRRIGHPMAQQQPHQRLAARSTEARTTAEQEGMNGSIACFRRQYGTSSHYIARIVPHQPKIPNAAASRSPPPSALVCTPFIRHASRLRWTTAPRPKLPFLPIEGNFTGNWPVHEPLCDQDGLEWSRICGSSGARSCRPRPQGRWSISRPTRIVGVALGFGPTGCYSMDIPRITTRLIKFRIEFRRVVALPPIACSQGESIARDLREDPRHDRAHSL